MCLVLPACPRVRVPLLLRARARAVLKTVCQRVSLRRPRGIIIYDKVFYRYYYVIIINTIIVILIIDSVIIFIFTGISIYIIKKRSYSPYCFLPNAQVSETKRHANPEASTLVADPAESG